MSILRRLTTADAEELTALRVRNRADYARWEPDWDDPDVHYTVEGVRAWIDDGNERFAIVDEGVIAGMISLTGIVRGAMQVAFLGYSVDRERAGRGLATRAIAEIADYGFGDLGLHRIEAGTAVENAASQRVLVKNRFTKVGLMRQNVLISGRWVDHFLWERLAGD